MIKTVLGIETSCDETAVAIYDGEQGLLAHKLYSQVEIHQQYGGVVPELASRDHVLKLLPLIIDCFKSAKLDKHDIDAIAYTKGPGLLPALMIGATMAKTLGFALNIPTLGVHHMEAHLMAALLEDAAIEYPFVALLVSGGHTMLLHVKGLGDYECLGETLDDAAGEAFDKTAKLMGLSYPGGPELAALAEQGNPSRFEFPRPMCKRPGFDFSYSGLKTHVVTCYQNNDHDPQTLADIACCFEDAIIDTLFIKSKRALEYTDTDRLVVVGGVSANKKLRSHLKTKLKNVDVYYPRHEFCTDNGAMVAYLGYLRLQHGLNSGDADWTIAARARWPINTID